MRQQTEAVHKFDSITKIEFNNLFDLLMLRTWEVDGYHYNLANLNWSWGYNTNKSRLGVCRSRQKSIEISTFLLHPNLATGAKEFEDTIRHEIAHAIDVEVNGSSSHGRQWQRIAIQVGAKPTRCSKRIETGKGKYTVKCTTCNHEEQAHRKRRGASACGKCCRKYAGGRYDKRFILQFIEN